MEDFVQDFGDRCTVTGEREECQHQTRKDSWEFIAKGQSEGACGWKTTKRRPER